MQNFRIRNFGHFVLGFTLMIVSGCKKPDANVRILFVHAVPGIPAVDFYLQGNIEASNINFGENTSYFPVSADSKSSFIAEVKYSGSTDNVATVFNPELIDGKSYSMFIFGDPLAIEKELFLEDYTAPAAGDSKVRFIHLAADAPALDVVANGFKVVTNKEYYGDNQFNGATGFQNVTTGSYTIELRLNSDGTTILTMPNVSFNEGKVYTLIAMGLIGGAGDQALRLVIIEND